MMRSRPENSRLSQLEVPPEPPAEHSSAQPESWLSCEAPESPRFWQVNDFAAGTIPMSYEPRYAYPVIVWLSGTDCGTDDALRHIADMSPQNYLGLAVEDCLFDGVDPDRDGFDLPVEFLKRLVAVENRIVSAVRSLRQVVNAHTERIFLAGAGDAAPVALLIAMHQPEWFAGGIAFGGQFPPAARLLAHRTALSGSRFFLGAPAGRAAWQTHLGVRHSAGQLVAAGADVSMSVNEAEAEALVTRRVLKELDEWIISGILADAS